MHVQTSPKDINLRASNEARARMGGGERVEAKDASATERNRSDPPPPLIKGVSSAAGVHALCRRGTAGADASQLATTRGKPVGMGGATTSGHATAAIIASAHRAQDEEQRVKTGPSCEVVEDHDRWSTAHGQVRPLRRSSRGLPASIATSSPARCSEDALSTLQSHDALASAGIPAMQEGC